MTSDKLQFQCNGNLFKIFKQVIKYLTFNIITLTFYRFWTVTNLRRYFWSSTKLDNQAFVYHGTGKELFFGAIAIFAILFVYQIIDKFINILLAEYFAILLIYAFCIFILFGFLFHFAIFRMLKYRMSRTSWKGLYFGLDGSAFAYAIRGLIVTLVDFLTLRIAYPWTRSYLLNHRLNRMRFGSQKFNAKITARNLMKAHYLFLIPMLLGLLGFSKIIYDNFSWDKLLNMPGEILTAEPNLFIMIPAIALLVVSFFLRKAYKIFEAKLIISHMQFDNIQIQNNLPIIKTSFIYCTLLVGYILTMGAMLWGVSALFTLFGWVAFISLYPYYLIYYYLSVGLFSWIVIKLVNHTYITGTDSLKDVSAYRTDEPKYAEGWFEMLDIGNL